MREWGPFGVRTSGGGGAASGSPDGCPLLRTRRLRREGLQCEPPPSADRIEGFHVLGAIDDKQSPVRTIRYDLPPLDDAAREIPAIPFAFLEADSPGVYRAVRTRPIPLARPEEDGSRGNVGVAPDHTGWLLRLLGFSVIVVLVLPAVLARGLRKRATEDDGAERARACVRRPTRCARRSRTEATSKRA